MLARDDQKLGRQPSRWDAGVPVPVLAEVAQQAPPAPPEVAYPAAPRRAWFGDDRFQSASCVAAAHAVQHWGAQLGRTGTVSRRDVERVYMSVSGFNPKSPEETDNGASMLDVLDFWLNTPDGQWLGQHLLGYLLVEPHNRAELRTAVHLFGCCYVGLWLPRSAQQQATWAIPPGGTTVHGQPGSWGGHAVCVIGYDPHGLTVVTWGAAKRMSWPFWEAYCDEAYALVSREWVDGVDARLSTLEFQFQTIVAEIADQVRSRGLVWAEGGGPGVSG